MKAMHDLIAHTFRQEAGRVIAALYTHMRDLELVEDAVQDALVHALERWPVARHRAIDRLRREHLLNRKKAALKTLLEEKQEEGELKEYYLFHAARADLLRRTGQLDEAQAAYTRTLELCQNNAEQAFLRGRLAEIQGQMRQ